MRSTDPETCQISLPTSILPMKLQISGYSYVLARLKSGLLLSSKRVHFYFKTFSFCKLQTAKDISSNQESFRASIFARLYKEKQKEYLAKGRWVFLLLFFLKYIQEKVKIPRDLLNLFSTSTKTRELKSLTTLIALTPFGGASLSVSQEC